MSGCTGSCCACFPISGTIEELRAKPERFADGAMLVDMLVPLTTGEAAERRARFGGEAPDADAAYFSCRHWDEDTRLCRVYEERPDMCRRYPYEREGGCDHGCDCKGEAAA